MAGKDKVETRKEARRDERGERRAWTMNAVPAEATIDMTRLIYFSKASV